MVDGTKVAEAEITAMMTPADRLIDVRLMQTETFIHPLAVVEPGAELGAGRPRRAVLPCRPRRGDRRQRRDRQPCRDHGRHHDRRGSRIFPQAALGGLPQNTKHKGGRTTLVIGANCTIREGVTMHVGTDTSRGQTIVGDNGNFLAYTHIAHDCIVGNNATFANGATLAGHCEIGDNVIIGGLTAIHQFARIGDNAFLSGCSAIPGDVIPFGIARGQPRQAARPQHHRHEALGPAARRDPRGAARLSRRVRPRPADRRKSGGGRDRVRRFADGAEDHRFPEVARQALFPHAGISSDDGDEDADAVD